MFKVRIVVFITVDLCIDQLVAEAVWVIQVYGAAPGKHCRAIVVKAMYLFLSGQSYVV